MNRRMWNTLATRAKGRAEHKPLSEMHAACDSQPKGFDALAPRFARSRIFSESARVTPLDET